MTPVACSPDAALEASGGDPFLRSQLRADVAARAWLGDGAVLIYHDEAPRSIGWLSCLGSPSACAELVGALAAALVRKTPHPVRLSLPRGAETLLGPPLALADVTQWDFRWTRRPPALQAGEDQVRWLDHAQYPDVEALLDAASPTASTSPGDDRARRWAGIYDDGHLVACLADTSGQEGVGHFSSIATSPSHRGRGLGAAVTGWAMRQLFEIDGCEVVTLGMYADNSAGRALYDRLGFADDHPFTSGNLMLT